MHEFLFATVMILWMKDLVLVLTESSITFDIYKRKLNEKGKLLLPIIFIKKHAACNTTSWIR